MDYAEAVLKLEERLDRTTSEAADNGLTTAEVVAELRRYADALEGDA